jgi:hypothetical protein
MACPIVFRKWGNVRWADRRCQRTAVQLRRRLLNDPSIRVHGGEGAAEWTQEP